MSMHEQLADDLALYALGTLEGDDRVAVEAHLRDCPACQSELERLRGDVALLAFSARGARPPARSRERLLSNVTREARRVPMRPARKRVWSTALQWAGAAAILAVFFLLIRQNDALRQHVNRLESGSASQQQQLVQARQLIAALSAEDADHFVLVAGQAPPQPQGRAVYLAKSGTLVFLASNMPVLPPEKAYELWLIPVSGAPIPAGVFRPNAEGSGSVVAPPLEPGTQAKTFAITVESKEGAQAPTSQPIMVGTKG
jgi:anti-sigma-K factor RskA